MNEVPPIPNAPADAGLRAPTSEPPGPNHATPESRRAFEAEITPGSELNESQAPATRKAIKRSLERFEGSPTLSGTGGASAPRTEAGGTSAPLPAATPASGDLVAGSAATTPRSDAADVAAVPTPTKQPATTPGSRAPVPSSGSVDRDAPQRMSGAMPAAVGGTLGLEKPDARRDSPSVTPEPATLPPEAARYVGRGGRKAATTPHSDAAAVPTPTKQPATTPGSRAPAAPSSSVDHGAQQRLSAGAPESQPTAPSDSSDQRIPPRGGREHPLQRRRGDSGETPAATGAPADHVDLSGLMAPAPVSESSATTAAEPVTTPATHVVELARQVADRILVSVPAPGAPEEVRISLNVSALDGSDIRIFREAGELKIVFVAHTEAARHLLADSKTAFQQTLAERLPDERVHVEVDAPHARDPSREDADGRARQQYVSPDDYSEIE